MILSVFRSPSAVAVLDEVLIALMGILTTVIYVSFLVSGLVYIRTPFSVPSAGITVCTSNLSVTHSIIIVICLSLRCETPDTP
jgi:hypothetical protein